MLSYNQNSIIIKRFEKTGLIGTADRQALVEEQKIY